MVVVVGVDEVGRGCLAGPVVAGAVILKQSLAVSRIKTWKLKDSKLLTREERETADKGIQKIALAIGLGWADVAEIDTFGLTEAVRLAMHRAVTQIALPFDELVIDGNYNFFSEDVRAKTLIKADATVPAVSAASIVAKVARDNWMRAEAAKHFPHYGFERHVGYGTKFHREMLRLHGACDLHRRSFKPIQLVLETST